MNTKIKKMRIPIELKQLQKNNNEHGISCVPLNEGDYSILIAKIPGPKSSPYEDGTFEVNINLGAQYPFQPPTFKFTTPIYHPNIDNSGKICLDLLRMPPAGSYNPAITLESILLSIQLLLASPNPDDPLNSEAADLFKRNHEQFSMKARELIGKERFAVDSTESVFTDASAAPSLACDTAEGPTAKRIKSTNMPSSSTFAK